MKLRIIKNETENPPFGHPDVRRLSGELSEEALTTYGAHLYLPIDCLLNLICPIHLLAWCSSRSLVDTWGLAGDNLVDL